MIRRILPISTALLLWIGFLSNGCQHASTKPKAAPATAHLTGWDKFLHEYLEGYFKRHPDVAVQAGRHEFDGQLPDWSGDGIRRVIDWLHAMHLDALQFDVTGLNERQRFEREYLLAQIEGELFWLESAQWPWRSPMFYSDLRKGLDPSVYVTRPYAPLPIRLKAFVKYAHAVTNAVVQIKKNLHTPMPRTFVDIGHKTISGLATYLETDVPTVFAPVKDKALQAEFQQINATAVKSLRDLDEWLLKQKEKANDRFALGADLFQEMLRCTERVDVPLDRLEALGRADLERNLAALKAACAKYAPGKSILECLDLINKEKPAGGPVTGARQQLNGLKEFLINTRLVTIPSRDEAKVEEAPPYARWNFAYIDIPGPYEKGLPAVYYIAPPDPAWSAEEREAYLPPEGDLLFTSIHEVWPGHFLQFLHSNRSQSKFGQVFVGYAFAEGWAHYAEEMMWEAGLRAGDPEIHIGQLRNALLRNVRFLSAIGLHTGKMTVEDSERMFREMAFQDPGNARQQAVRGTFDPAYLNYTMGKLMIRKLREDWTKTRGGREGWGAFHDELLSYGGPPIPLLRRQMLGTNAGPPF
ncbi:MAG: DUF885 domain-containing protein [Verrucomicrobiota bacterium]|jgi:hypothetical protein